MGVPGNANALLLRSAAAAGGYQVSRSLRFNSSDSAYLSRTPASAGNRKTWTWAGWVKRSNLTDQQAFWSAGSTGTNRTSVLFDGSARIRFFNYAGSVDVDLVTTPVYRDASAWYHVVISVDTTQGTSANRFKLYINGAQVTTFSTATYPSLNQDLVFNSAIAHGIGRGEQSGGEYFSGYLADVHFIDGQALDPTSFTEVSATTGQLIPKAYTGTYGTNGFKLTFSDNSNTTATTLGKDTSGNGNNFTPTNFSVAAGAGNDSLTDTPTSYGTDDSLGGSVRGNYCTLNPLASAGTMSNGNLDGYNAVNTTSHATFAMPSSGKWYFEGVMTSGNLLNLGLASYRPNGHIYSISNSVLYSSSGVKNVDGVNDLAYGASFTTGDVIGVACDADSGSVTFYKNGVSQGAITHQVGGLFPSFGNGGVAVNYTVNFGQRPWAYTPPANHRPLVDTFLSTPVAKPNTVFDVVKYIGNGTAQTVSGLNFSPDFLWGKNRSSAFYHILVDSIRGATARLFSNTTDAESVFANSFTAFTSNGFSVGSASDVNNNNDAIVTWCWDAGSSTVTNTQGSITGGSQVRANPSSGFSVVTWTGQSTAATIGHGLNAAPSLIICKARSNAQSWGVYHKDTGINNYLLLDSTGAATAYSGIWGSSAPTSTVFGVPGNVGLNNNSGWTYVAYCFAPVAGYSSFGSYTGNGSTDGPFVFCGFRPRWILVKRTDGVIQWTILDTARSPSNVADQRLFPNLSQAETVNGDGNTDLLSNGFKPRNIDSAFNANGGTYIYAAFAESPLQYSRAR